MQKPRNPNHKSQTSIVTTIVLRREGMVRVGWPKERNPGLRVGNPSYCPAMLEPPDVELDGRWDDPIRSAATNCPITVFTDGYLLTLKNASPDRDMTIRITDMAKGGVVYENDIPEVQSAYITISIANFPAEEYKLEITGTPSGHLTGYFTKE